MRILLLVHSYNSLSQRIYVELTADGHEVSVEFDIHESVTAEALALFRPDVVVAPYLKRAIPESIYRSVPCLVLHPGIVGDGGPCALDWAILSGERDWGVTVIEANAVLDGGDVWSTREFPMRAASKGSVYRIEVTEAAVDAIREALTRMQKGERAAPLSSFRNVRGTYRGPVGRERRRVDFAADSTDVVLRKIRCSDPAPGAIGCVGGTDVRLYNASAVHDVQGAPGEVLAAADGALCIATMDSAVWVTHGMRVTKEGEWGAIKLPLTRVVDTTTVREAASTKRCASSCAPIRYEEHGSVGSLTFEFLNGAMGVSACEELLAALEVALRRPTRVLILWGGRDFFCNGIDLREIEASEAPAEHSWRNILAMNALVRAMIVSTGKILVVGMRGNAAAGGVFAALAADRIVARSGVVLSPHYRNMGNLHGSEYWTYLLPRRVGERGAAILAKQRLPMGTTEALGLGLIDEVMAGSPEEFMRELTASLERWAHSPAYDEALRAKVERRAADEARKPLDAYAREELSHMKQNFFGFDPSYHVARYNFVYRVPHSRTPLYLARHRQRSSTERIGGTHA